jgi:hypothetical protein
MARKSDDDILDRSMNRLEKVSERVDRLGTSLMKLGDGLDKIVGAVVRVLDRVPEIKELASIGEVYIAGSLGLRSPTEQVVGNTLLFGAIIATSAVGLLGTLLLLPLPITMFTLGLFRFNGTFEKYWPLDVGYEPMLSSK